MASDDNHWKDRDKSAGSGKPGGEGREDPEEVFQAGLFLFKRGRLDEAFSAFRRAFEAKNNEPRYMSYYGLCLAKSGSRIKEGVVLCEKAVQREFFRPELFLNLGMAYQLAGNRRKCHTAFRKGLALERDNRDIKEELDRMGVRKPPVFPFLDRKNVLNKLAGKVMYRLRIR